MQSSIKLQVVSNDTSKAETIKRVYTVLEISQILGFSQKTVYEKCRSGDIPHLKVGRKFLFPVVKFDRWFNGESSAK